MFLWLKRNTLHVIGFINAGGRRKQKDKTYQTMIPKSNKALHLKQKPNKLTRSDQ